MQNAKDTFYRMLRDRIAERNAARVVVIGGVQRTAVIVEENELPSAALPPETFVLRWTEADTDVRGAMPMLRMTCTIRYETTGSEAAGGMDRGRRLAAMDAELMRALLADPQRVVKTDATATPPVALRTNIFWGPPVLGALERAAERMGRTTSVTVYSVREGDE